MLGQKKVKGLNVISILGQNNFIFSKSWTIKVNNRAYYHAHDQQTISEKRRAAYSSSFNIKGKSPRWYSLARIGLGEGSTWFLYLLLTIRDVSIGHKEIVTTPQQWGTDARTRIRFMIVMVSNIIFHHYLRRYSHLWARVCSKRFLHRSLSIALVYYVLFLQLLNPGSLHPANETLADQQLLQSYECEVGNFSVASILFLNLPHRLGTGGTDLHKLSARSECSPAPRRSFLNSPRRRLDKGNWNKRGSSEKESYLW